MSNYCFNVIIVMNFDLNILLSLALVEQLGFLWETFSLSCFKTKQLNEVPPCSKCIFCFELKNLKKHHIFVSQNTAYHLNKSEKKKPSCHMYGYL